MVALSNLGSPILVRRPPRAGRPYHRNITGNLLTLDAFRAAEQARTAIDDNRIGLVALCRGNAETGVPTELAPADFLAALTRSDAPSWLEELPQAASELLEI